jgi:ABC-2 type transport system permease protein
MIFTIAILKEVKIMNNLIKQTQILFFHIKGFNWFAKEDTAIRPFWTIVNKEISDHVRSWRFIILLAIIALTCFGSLYTALSNFSKAVKPNDPEGTFFFLKLFTLSDGSMPPFFVFISFLGPLLGISLGFDAVNSEQNRGTLSRVLAQPIHRDYLINAKFVASLIVISVMFFALGFLVMGIGLIEIGIPPTAEEFLRIISFIILSIVYVAFWLNLSILFSVRFRQPATSALSGIAVWLFFTVFYPIILKLISSLAAPSVMASTRQIALYEILMNGLTWIMPNKLFDVATTTLLMPTIHSLGPLTMEQQYGALPGPLPLSQSLLLVWPQVISLMAGTILCFVLSYLSFMRREIRSR